MKYVFKLNGREVTVTEEILSIMQCIYRKEIKVEHVDNRVRLTAAKWLVKNMVDDQIRTRGVIDWNKAAEEAIELIIEDAVCEFVDSLIDISKMENDFVSWGVPSEVIKFLEDHEDRIAEIYTIFLHQPNFLRPTKLVALLDSLEEIGDAEYRIHAEGHGDQHKVNGDMCYNAVERIEYALCLKCCSNN